MDGMLLNIESVVQVLHRRGSARDELVDDGDHVSESDHVGVSKFNSLYFVSNVRNHMKK